MNPDTPKKHRVHKKGGKAKRKASTVQRYNPKAFTFSGGVDSVRKRDQRNLDQQAKREKAHLIVDEEAYKDCISPLIVVVQGPPECGKSTLIRSLVKHYSKRNVTNIHGSITISISQNKRLTFLECPNDVSSMLDLAKVADIALILINASFGFEMQTFEFINMLQVHGFPKIIGVLTHLDKFKETKQLRNVKQTFKSRFWSELYDGAKLFNLSGVQYNRYLKMETRNLARFISTQKRPLLSYRSKRPYLVVMRIEDHTPVTSKSSDKKKLHFYGYVRGTTLFPKTVMHIPGLGDFKVSSVEPYKDPCTLPSVSTRTLKKTDRLIYAPLCDIGNVQYEPDAVYIHVPQHKIGFTRKQDILTDGDNNEESFIVQQQTARDATKVELKTFGGVPEDDVSSNTISSSDDDETQDASQYTEHPSESEPDRKSDRERSESTDESEVHQITDLEDEDVPEAVKLVRKLQTADDALDHVVESMKMKLLPDSKTLAATSTKSCDSSGKEHEEHSGGDSRVRNPLIPKFSTFEPQDKPLYPIDICKVMLNPYYNYNIQDLIYRPDPKTLAAAHSVKKKYNKESNVKSLFDSDDSDDSNSPSDTDVDPENILLGNLVTDDDPDDNWDPTEQDLADLFNEPLITDENQLKALCKKYLSNIICGDEHEQDAQSEQENEEEGEEQEEEEQKSKTPSYKHEHKKRLHERQTPDHTNTKISDEDDADDDHSGISDSDNFSEDLKDSAQVEAPSKATTEKEKPHLKKDSEFRARLDEEAKKVREQHEAIIKSGNGAIIGTYVRVVVQDVASEWYNHMQATKRHVILGGLLPEETRTTGEVQCRVKTHRWAPRILKTNDPLLVSCGWRRFQIIPMYCIEDRNQARIRMLKYTLEHLHCLMVFYGPSSMPGAGILGIRNWFDNLQDYRINMTGVVTDTDAAGFKIVKKLKLIGEPQKIMKNSAFIQKMFNSNLEVAKFMGAKIQTVSGIRGQIKKAQGADGTFRATFEDKILKSDIVVCKTWIRVHPHHFFSLMLDVPEWSRLRTLAELRSILNLPAPNAKETDYGSRQQRVTRRFNPLKIPKSIEINLPFKSKDKPKKKLVKEHGLLAEATAATYSEYEKTVATLFNRLNLMKKTKDEKRRKAFTTKIEAKTKLEAKIQEKREQHKKENKKHRYIKEGLQQKEMRKRMRLEN